MVIDSRLGLDVIRSVAAYPCIDFNLIPNFASKELVDWDPQAARYNLITVSSESVYDKFNL